MSRRTRNNKGDSLRLMIQHGNRSTESQGEHAEPPQPQRNYGRLIFVPLNKSNSENLQNPAENEENIDVNADDQDSMDDTSPPTQPREEQNINIINNNNNYNNNNDNNNNDNDRLPDDRRFFPRENDNNINEQTNILDIHPKDWGGILCANAQPFDFIPHGLESIIRKVFAQYGIRLIESPTIDNWKKYLLLPTILFDSRRGMTNCERKAFIRECCNKLLAQEWTSFNVGKYTRRNNEINYDDYRDEELIHKRAKKQVSAGELSKALKTLRSNRRIIPLDQATLEILKSKFPDPCIHDVLENEIMQTNNFSATGEQKFVFDEQYMRKMILSMPKTTAPGLDKCRFYCSSLVTFQR